MLQAEGRARLDDTVVYVNGLLGRDVELVSQFTHVSDAYAQHASEADIDLPRGAEGEGLIGQIRAGN